MSATVLRQGAPDAGTAEAGAETRRREAVGTFDTVVTGSARLYSRSLNKMLGEALCLLDYAVEAGIVVDAAMAQRLIDAAHLGDAAWTEPAAGNLVSDMAKLAALVHPVTAATLVASQTQAHATIRTYKRVAILLALVIIPWSVTSFIFTGINNSIVADLATADALVVSLHSEVGTPATSAGGNSASGPANSLSDLQQFAANIRAIHRHTNQLVHFVPVEELDPVGPDTKLELDTNLANQWNQIQTNLIALTGTFQKVRTYAKAVQDDGAAVYGAISTCVLPIFYAVLGACAYLLREFSDKLEKRTFAPTYSTVARFVVAAIGGGIIGLFNNFTVGQTVTLPPLAVAFLVGYGADVFFSFIEGSLQTVRKPTEQTARSSSQR